MTLDRLALLVLTAAVLTGCGIVAYVGYVLAATYHHAFGWTVGVVSIGVAVLALTDVFSVWRRQ